MEIKYDYIIVGAGFFGSICAYELTKAGYKCLVVEKRNHIGGNCYTTNRNEINVHEYGPHIFHTSNEDVWKYINQFVEFNNFTLRPVANFKGEIFSLPFNMWTFNKMWNVITPSDAKKKIESQSSEIENISNLEDAAIKLVGKDIYHKLIEGYTSKQWKKHPKELPSSIIKRLPVRFTYDNNYFEDKYQGIPIGGYTQIFEKMLDGIEVLLETDFFENKEEFIKNCDTVIYTGAIDTFYDYRFGELEYKTTRFDHYLLNTSNYQGTAMMNFTDIETPYTRIIEHKHFENSISDVTWITQEYPIEYKAGVTEPYYPVNDEINNLKYEQYKELSNKEENILFGGRLAEYKYYDMDEVVESALNFVKSVLIKNNYKFYWNTVQNWLDK